MSLAVEAEKFGRKTTTMCQILPSTCSLTFGVSPCTATGEECYNTRSTCKDTENFTSSTVTHSFIDKDANVPIGENMWPCLIKASIAPNRVTFGKGLGYRGKVTVTLQDFKHDDIGIDPYQSSRSYDTSQGTFFGKLIARNKYYIGRKIKIMSGYLDGVAYDADNFETREYLIENIDGPDSKGVVKITGIDTLKKIDNDRAQCPAPSEGVLLDDIADTDTTLTITPAAAVYGASGLIRVGDEIMEYTRAEVVTHLGIAVTHGGETVTHGGTGAEFTITRGMYGRAADDHSSDDTVQECKKYDENCVNILYDLLLNYGNIDTSYLPFNDNPSSPDDWDDEKADWLYDVNHFTIISEPTGVATLVEELTYQSMMLIWADPLTQKIKIKAISPVHPTDTVPVYDGDSHIIGDSIKIQKADNERITQMWVAFSPYDWSQLRDSEDYSQTYIKAALAEEGDDLYGDSRVDYLKSRWFTGQNRVSSFSSALVNYAKDAPVTIPLSVDAADKIEIGDYIDIVTRLNQDETGAYPIKRFYVIESKETETAHRFALKVRTSFFDDVEFCWMAPDDAVDYTSDTAEYRRLYWYFTDDDGLNSDGSVGDVWI